MPDDMKESLSSGRKPDLSHASRALNVYDARAKEYGSAKYERANYLRATRSLAHDVERYRQYLAASLRHTLAILESITQYQAQGPSLRGTDDGIIDACYAVDDDYAEDCPVGPSLLPHIAGAIASLSMALEQAIDAGILPRDPGQPWARRATAATVSDAPATLPYARVERAAVVPPTSLAYTPAGDFTLPRALIVPERVEIQGGRGHGLTGRVVDAVNFNGTPYYRVNTPAGEYWARVVDTVEISNGA